MYVNNIYTLDEDTCKKRFCGILLASGSWRNRRKTLHCGIMYDIDRKKYIILNNSYYDEKTETDNFFEILSEYKARAEKNPEHYEINEKALHRFINRLSLYEQGKLKV